jgi:hypothetical protein
LCFTTEREALWRVVDEAIYGSMWGEWCSNEVVGSLGLGLELVSGKIFRGDGGFSLDSSGLR